MVTGDGISADEGIDMIKGVAMFDASVTAFGFKPFAAATAVAKLLTTLEAQGLLDVTTVEVVGDA